MIFTAVISLTVGSVDISLTDIFNSLFDNNNHETASQIIFNIRLPRVLLAIAVGGGLSVAGAVFQAILMNPLAEPYILGVSSGGTFGAVLSFLLGLSFLGTQLFAFSGALAVIFLVFMLGKRFGELEPNILLLTGVMVGAFFAASILLMMSMLQDNLRTAVFWLIGNLSLAKSDSVYYVLPITLVVSFILVINSQKYNVLALGAENAKQLGININLVRNRTTLLQVYWLEQLFQLVELLVLLDY